MQNFLSKINKIGIRLKQSAVKSSKFFLDYLKFKKFLKRQNIIIKDNTQEKKSFCVVAIPWLGASVPWYAITIAILLNQKEKNAFILLDDMPFGDNVFFTKIQAKLIRKILKRIGIPYKILSQYGDTGKLNYNLIKL